MSRPTYLALKDHYDQLTVFLNDYDNQLSLARDKYHDLAELAISAQKDALTFKTGVGAAVLTKSGAIFQGCNIENLSRSMDDHAEKRAVSAALFAGCGKNDFVALALVYGSKNTRDTSYAYPACGLCRQYMWENTNPDMDVIVTDPDGVITFCAPLRLIYPLAYPAFDKIPERIKIPSR